MMQNFLQFLQLCLFFRTIC